MEEPGRLQSMGSRSVRHDWATSLSLFTFMHWWRKWQPTPVFLPGESHEIQNFPKTKGLCSQIILTAVFQWVEDLWHAGAGSYHCMIVLRECKLFSIIKFTVFTSAFTESLVSGITLFFFLTWLFNKMKRTTIYHHEIKTNFHVNKMKLFYMDSYTGIILLKNRENMRKIC